MQIASRKVIAGLMVSALCITTLSSAGSDVEAKAKASLKTKKISVKVGKKKSILIKNKTKKHSYSFTSSNKQVAKVTSKGKVTGIKAGKATITVKEVLKKGKKKKGKKKKRTLGKVKVTVTGMKKKNVAALMAAALTASMLAGCDSSASSSAASTPAESTPTESVAESEAETTTADGDETLTVWAWDPNFNIYALKQAEAIYQKDHPNFKLNIEENVYSDIETKLITAATSEDYSTLPDLFLMQDYSYHKMVANFPGIYTDLTDSGLDWDKFSGGKLADSTVDGHHYGLPFDNGASVMAVRSDMIENAGLTVDDFKDLTWSEFEEKAQKVVDANGVPMLTSSGGSELIIEMMQSAGASPVVDGEVKIADNAALKESLTVYKDMVDKGILAEYTDWDQYIASMNDGKAAGVINGCWIMSSVQAAADQSGKWAIVNMPKLDGIDGATNYANCGGASWAVSSNCKNTELAFDFLKSTFGSSVELYDDLLPNAGAISSYLPAAESDVYNQPSEFYGGQTVYKDIVEFAGKVPAFDCGAYYSDVRSALTDAVTNIVQNNADIDSEMQNAQDTVEFNIAG